MVEGFLEKADLELCLGISVRLKSHTFQDWRRVVYAMCLVQCLQQK